MAPPMDPSLRVFDSVQALLSPAALGELIGARVLEITREPLRVEHFSGSRLEKIRLSHAQGALSLILKQFSYERDWVMRLTHDLAVREVALYRTGIYARMPQSVEVPVLAVARAGETWASLMNDVSPALIPAEPPVVPVPVLADCIRALAAVHARFMDDPVLEDPALGLSTLDDFISILSPAVVRRELDAGRAHPVLEYADAGWARFFDRAPASIADGLRELQNDPAPLLHALASGPRTLLHGDFKFSNLGLKGMGEASGVIVLDWQDAAAGPPLLDLGYFLAVSGPRLALPPEDIVGLYRGLLEANGAAGAVDLVGRDVDLGLLAGGALRLMWQKALALDLADADQRERAQSQFEWWSELVLRALRWL